MSADQNQTNQLITENLDIWTSAIKAKGRTGRGSNKTYELYGIKKLRNLILDMAVRGLLVPQDPNDESASELLKKIAAEKEHLIKKGKLKKQKALSPINEEEKPFELPEGWEWDKLGNFIYLEMGQSPPSKYYNQDGEGMPFFQGKADFGEKYPTPRYWCIKPQKYSYINDVLLSVRAPVGPTNISNINCCIGRGLAALRPLLDVPTMYIDCLLKGFRSQLESFATGTTFAAVSKVVVENFLISIPPLKEQKRIVAKVEELMILCDQLEQKTDTSIKAHKLLVENLLNALTQAKDHKTFQQAWQRIAENFGNLFTTEHSIDQLQQTILQLAVMGKLVPQDPKDEPASELLKKIAAEKAKLIKEGKIKKQKPLPPISDEEKPFELPEGWGFYRLDKTLNKITDGTHHSPKNGSSGEYYYISAKNIKDDGVKTTNATFVTKEIHDDIYSRCNPERGDILYIKDGATTGIVTLNNLDEPFSMLSSVALLKPSKKLNNKYLLIALRSPFFYSEMRSGMSGVAITRVTLKKLNFAFIPIPPFNEQKRIVTKVDELIALGDQLKSQITHSKKIQTKIADALTKITN